MTKKRRLTREESKAKTRADLLRAANRLFLKNGFVATSLSQIAEEAALTKGAVYSNFASKEDLFLAVLDDEQTRREEGERELGPYAIRDIDGETPAERAATFGRNAAAAKVSRRYMALFLEMNAVALRDDRARKWVNAHNDEFFESFGAELCELLDAPAEDAYLLGVLVQSLYVGLSMHGAFSDDGLDTDAYERIFSMLTAFSAARR